MSIMKKIILALMVFASLALVGCCTDNVCGTSVSYVATPTCATCNTCNTCSTCATCGYDATYTYSGWY